MQLVSRKQERPFLKWQDVFMCNDVLFATCVNVFKNEEKSDHRLIIILQTHVRRTALCYCNICAIVSSQHNHLPRTSKDQRNISRDTVFRRLLEVRLHPYRSAIRPRLTQVHRRDRLQWDIDVKQCGNGKTFGGPINLLF
ncbi:hypothetical protein PoB_001513100 [Plakobranchus ocellatus]|uniref:Transposase Tc1-like domain-containing protein n=1 Tax=Plakobranchus ocellatus TaxID=259542 RepID=A0AAV3YN04_9GAST|nr:hypothetical protein PoB_001513100 [Plakobranchus ocellatus]